MNEGKRERTRVRGYVRVNEGTRVRGYEGTRVRTMLEICWKYVGNMFTIIVVC